MSSPRARVFAAAVLPDTRERRLVGKGLPLLGRWQDVILERPFAEVSVPGQPDFPFCLCWASQTWTGIGHGAP